MKKIVLWTLLVMITVAAVYVWIVYLPQLPVANGYAAKKMCSCTFIADRDPDTVQDDDLNFGPLTLTSTTVDRDKKKVRTTLLGLVPRVAAYRRDLGCVLLNGPDDYEVELTVDRQWIDQLLPWPHGNRVTLSSTDALIDRELMEAAVARAFDPSMRMDSLKTRAVVVVHQGTIVAEKYAEEFDADTEILGWSMTKSIMSTLIGVLVKNGRMNLNDTHLFAEWADKRSQIALRDLLNMQSGLKFAERYGALSDATRMLFMSENVSAIPIEQQLEYEPGTHWAYSSGTTNLLSELLYRELKSDDTYWRFPYDSLFARIGMTSAVIETDESGRFIASSYCYATPRDWARLGLLYLNHGNWFGDQIIDSSWVDFVRTPASASGGIYGGHFWLNAGSSAYPDVPDDLFSCNGFQGQYVFVIPSYDLVVVRMGLAEDPVFDINAFLKNILASIRMDTMDDDLYTGKTRHASE